MLTPQDVRSVQFEKNLRGYRTEDVDRFLDKVEEQLQQNDAQAEQLRKQIVLGNAAPDSPLPSVRQLSVELGVNPNTIQKAYREMEQEGLIVSLPGRGSFVTSDVARMQERQRAAELANLEKALRLCREIGISYTSVQALTNKVYKEESSC